LPTVYFVHDFYPLWPLLHRNLDDAGTTFDATQLAADLSTPIPVSSSPNAIQLLAGPAGSIHRRCVEAQACLAAPSRAAMTILLRLQPRLSTLLQNIIPHGMAPWPAAIMRLPVPPLRPRLRLIVLGACAAAKRRICCAPHYQNCVNTPSFLLGAGPESEEFSASATCTSC